MLLSREGSMSCGSERSFALLCPYLRMRRSWRSIRMTRTRWSCARNLGLRQVVVGKVVVRVREAGINSWRGPRRTIVSTCTPAREMSVTKRASPWV